MTGGERRNTQRTTRDARRGVQHRTHATRRARDGRTRLCERDRLVERVEVRRVDRGDEVAHEVEAEAVRDALALPIPLRPFPLRPFPLRPFLLPIPYSLGRNRSCTGSLPPGQRKAGGRVRAAAKRKRVNRERRSRKRAREYPISRQRFCGREGVSGNGRKWEWV